jgi:hypothetical protein
MPPISFSDEEVDLLSALASALPPSVRGAFLEIVSRKLGAYPPEARGPGPAAPCRGPHGWPCGWQHDTAPNRTARSTAAPCSHYGGAPVTITVTAPADCLMHLLGKSALSCQGSALATDEPGT